MAKRRGTVEGCNEVDATGPEGGRAGDGDEAEVADDRGRRPGTKWRKGQSHLECPISWQFISPAEGRAKGSERSTEGSERSTEGSERTTEGSD